MMGITQFTGFVLAAVLGYAIAQPTITVERKVNSEPKLLGLHSGNPGPRVHTKVAHNDDLIRRQNLPIAEDPVPLVNVTSCGALIESSSASITLQTFTPGQGCAITLKLPFISSRFILTQSSLVCGDVLLATRIEGGQPATPVQISQVGRNYTGVGGGIIVLSLTLSQNSSTTRSLRLQVYSSGFSQYSVLSGHAALSTSSAGNYSYPHGGGYYQNNEHAVISLAGPANRRLTFTYMDLEGYDCIFDVVRVYTLQNNQYTQAVRTCWTTIPSPVSLGSGIALITFVSDDFVNLTGFSVSYA